MKNDTSKNQTIHEFQPFSAIAWLIQRLQQRAEPRVSEQLDRAGNLYYQVYNPQTGKSAAFGSPAEIRWWIEQQG
jgi:hypothetical protein